MFARGDIVRGNFVARSQGYVGGSILVMGTLGLLGCALVGPQSITAGRGDYAEVINKTEDEQVLNLIVRNRYDETSGMISVASVTASLKFSARAGTDIGIGDSDNYSGNLVPLSAGVAYEENPTISYVPLSGEDFLLNMLSPISLEQLLMLSSMAKTQGNTLDIMVRRINGQRNTVVGDEPPSPEFLRMVDLFAQLRQGNVVDVSMSAEKENEYFFVFHDYKDAYSDSVRELLALLGIKKEIDGKNIVLPIRSGVGSGSDSVVNIQTRSALDLLKIYGAGIDIPLPHLEAGIVQPTRWAVSGERRPIEIRSSEKRPEDATVSIRFRDWWFYIDATDTRSKQAFQLFRIFLGLRLKDAGTAQRAPILTVPVK